MLLFFFIMFAYCVVIDFICSHVSKENKIKLISAYSKLITVHVFLFLYVIFPLPVLSQNTPILSNDIKTIQNNTPVPLNL